MPRNPLFVMAAVLLASALPSQSILSNIGVNTTANNSSSVSEIAIVGGLAYFSASGNYGRELYVSDGSQAGSSSTWRPSTSGRDRMRIPAI